MTAQDKRTLKWMVAQTIWARHGAHMEWNEVPADEKQAWLSTARAVLALVRKEQERDGSYVMSNWWAAQERERNE